MTLDMMLIVLLQFITASVKRIQLAHSVFILVKTVGRGQMGEYRFRGYKLLGFQYFYQSWQLFLDKPEPMHTCIQLNMYRILLYIPFFTFCYHL